MLQIPSPQRPEGKNELLLEAGGSGAWLGDVGPCHILTTQILSLAVSQFPSCSTEFGERPIFGAN